jgi:antagonist of KipI
MGFIRVLEPGMLSTVQDLGRAGWAARGVPTGGAADPFSLRLGNRLVGNADAAPGVEMTLTGAALHFEHDALVALTGAEAAASVGIRGGVERSMKSSTATPIRAGECLRVGPARRGARAYLCVAGGLRVPCVLGSASTHLAAGFGGFEGRALRAGDRLEFDETLSPAPAARSARGAREIAELVLARRSLRAVPGASGDVFEAEAADRFWDSEYSVTPQSDRAGLRLEGPAVRSRSGGRMISEGMYCGAVQVPENGQPIILCVDHPTTGGYPVIACVVTVDLPVLGQLRPGDHVRFERTTLEGARELFRELERRLDELIPPVARDVERSAVSRGSP